MHITLTAANPLVTAENWDWELELGRRTDHGPNLDIRACDRIFDEPVDGAWGAFTSASLPTFRPRRPADDRCSDRPALSPSPKCLEGGSPRTISTILHKELVETTILPLAISRG